MLIDFNAMKEITVDNMNGGEGSVCAKMFVNESGKVIVSRILPKSSIGLHLQTTGNDINFVVSGFGKAVCGGEEEVLSPGVCHYCPKGEEHTIINTGEEKLVLYTVVG
ncbi:MAG: cupin domain-containing protein [Clostridia bacterium]|nr:cupin domain-containing protein [Clostridia bacterium]